MSDKFTLKNILLVADGTENGVHAARFAVKLGALHKLNLTAIAVVDTATLKSLLTSSILVESEMQEFDRELEASAGANLNYVVQLAREAGIECNTLLERGAAHSILFEEVRRSQPDLLIMGTFSTTLIKRDLNARERRRIVDEVKCPILLIP